MSSYTFMCTANGGSWTAVCYDPEKEKEMDPITADNVYELQTQCRTAALEKLGVATASVSFSMVSPTQALFQAALGVAGAVVAGGGGGAAAAGGDAAAAEAAPAPAEEEEEEDDDMGFSLFD